MQLHKASEAREKGERRVKQMEEEAKRKDEEILELKSKVKKVLHSPNAFNNYFVEFFSFP